MTKFKVHKVVASGQKDENMEGVLSSLGFCIVENNETTQGCCASVDCGESCFLCCDGAVAEEGTPFVVVVVCGSRGKIVDSGYLTSYSEFDSDNTGLLLVGRGDIFSNWWFHCEQTPLTGEAIDWLAMFCLSERQ